MNQLTPKNKEPKSVDQKTFKEEAISYIQHQSNITSAITLDCYVCGRGNNAGSVPLKNKKSIIFIHSWCNKSYMKPIEAENSKIPVVKSIKESE